MITDERRQAAGLGGHLRAALQSSAAGSTQQPALRTSHFPDSPTTTLRRPSQPLDKHRGTQVLNAVLLLPLLLFMYGLARDPDLMGGHHARGASTALYLATIALVTTCIAALFVLTLL